MGFAREGTDTPFREAPSARRQGRVTHGPFPLGGGKLALGLALLTLTPAFGLIALQEQTLSCAPAPDGSCALVDRIPPGTTTFPVARLRGARVDRKTGSKGAKYGVVVLLLEDRQLELMDLEPGDAEAAAREVRSGLAGAQAFSVTVHGPQWMGILAVGALAGMVWSVASALRRMGRFRLVVLADRPALRVTRKLFGIPVGSRELSLEGVSDVGVEQGALPSDSARQPPIDAGRLLLVLRHGDRVPLTDRMFPGQAVHLRAAAALRAILGFEPKAGGVEERLAAIPWRTTSLARRCGLAWAGLTTGSLLGAGVLGLAGLALGLWKGGDGFQEWVLLPGAVGGVAFVLYLTRKRPPI